jgi:hypothetical protein
VTLIEFKLTTLAGFVLIPFGLFGKTAFMAERVLGNVVSSGIKVLVLAVIIGIGSTLFSQFTSGFGGATPTIDDAMAIVLDELTKPVPKVLLRVLPNGGLNAREDLEVAHRTAHVAHELQETAHLTSETEPLLESVRLHLRSHHNRQHATCNTTYA